MRAVCFPHPELEPTGPNSTARLVMGRLSSLRLRALHNLGEEAAPPSCTIVTQCSLDRLDKLVAQAAHWPGDMVGAVLSFDGASGERVPRRVAEQRVREACARIGATPRSGSVRLALFEEEGDRGGCRGGGELARLYPINAMRNAALGLAGSELVLPLDVDFLPSAGLHAEVAGSAAELRRLCVEERRLLVSCSSARPHNACTPPPITPPTKPPSCGDSASSSGELLF